MASSSQRQQKLPLTAAHCASPGEVVDALETTAHAVGTVCADDLHEVQRIAQRVDDAGELALQRRRADVCEGPGVGRMQVCGASVSRGTMRAKEWNETHRQCHCPARRGCG